jgi:hypothetical protein
MKAKTKKVPDQITSKSDESGNLILIKNNGVRLILTLKLKSETKGRRLGIVNIDRKTFEVKRKREKHLFIKNQSYGFNHKLLIDATKFDKIRLSDEKNEWLIPKDYILNNGSFLHFKSSGGFERQIFIELDKLKEFERGLKI